LKIKKDELELYICKKGNEKERKRECEKVGVESLKSIEISKSR